MSDLCPTDKPLAWVGADRILLNDTTSLGIRRRVVARKDDIPQVIAFLQAAFDEARGAKVHWWLVQKADGFVYLWMIWKATER